MSAVSPAAIDTAELRQRWISWRRVASRPTATQEDVHALCDALDAERAKVARLRTQIADEIRAMRVGYPSSAWNTARAAIAEAVARGTGGTGGESDG